MQKLEEAYKLIEENGYQHLTVARASFYRDYTIQSLLPITEETNRLRLGRYIENEELFTDAIREFTGFICQAKLDDLTGFQLVLGRYQELPRFDNAVPYIEDIRGVKKGKIALADLDDFVPHTRGVFGRCYEYLGGKSVQLCCDTSYQVETMIQLFPYHRKRSLMWQKNSIPGLKTPTQSGLLSGIRLLRCAIKCMKSTLRI